MVFSQNGWTANNRSLTKQWTIPGTIRKITLESGDAGYLLCDFAAWFDKNVEDIEAGQLDDWGYAERTVRDGTDLSNHASGTAIDLNAPKHALGAVNTFTPAQATAIRNKLKNYAGVIRWGGDYIGRKDEMHFEINASSATVKRIADKIRGGGTPAPTERKNNVVTDYEIPAGNGGRRFLLPVGPTVRVTAQAWINISVNGPSAGKVKVFYQSATDGIRDTGPTPRTLNFKNGISQVFNEELPAGTVQIVVQWEFPEGGTIAFEQLSR